MKRVELIQRVNRLGSTIAGASLFFMMLVGALDIIGSKFLSLPLPAALETTEALMVVTAFMALAYSQSRREHISVDIVFCRLPPSAQRLLGILSHILTLSLIILIAWQGWHLGYNSWAVREYASGVISFPIYPAKILLAVGASLMVIQCLHDLITSFVMLIRKPEERK